MISVTMSAIILIAQLFLFFWFRNKPNKSGFNDTVFSNLLLSDKVSEDKAIRRLVIKRKWKDGRLEFFTHEIIVQE